MSGIEGKVILITLGGHSKPASRGHLKTGQLRAFIQDKNWFYLAGYVSGKSNFAVPDSSLHLLALEGEIERLSPSFLFD
jgi:hypothetical protein